MLELTIIAGAGLDNPTQKKKIFADEGGIIGRDQQADWVLYDPSHIVSGQHARVIYSCGVYRLLDLSVNGTFTGMGEPLRKGDSYPLKVGEVYQIGPYRFEVTTLGRKNPFEFFDDRGLGHILAEPATLMSQPTPLVYLEKQQPKADFFMPEPLEIPFRQKNDWLHCFCQRFNLPQDALNGFSEEQFQTKIFDLLECLWSNAMMQHRLTKHLQAANGSLEQLLKASEGLML